MSISKVGSIFCENFLEYIHFFNDIECISIDFVKPFYKLMKEATELCDVYTNQENMRTKKYIKETITHLPDNEFDKRKYLNRYPLIDSKMYTPDNINIYVKRKTNYIHKYSFSIENKEYNLEFFVVEGEYRNIETKMMRILKHTIKTIYVLLKLLGDNLKMKSLHIYIALTKFKKVIPREKSLTLSKDHINTGLTYACQVNGRIFLYREEEICKVLIHEIMHAKCVDFATVSINEQVKKQLQSMFYVNSDFSITESYTEFWANILNTLFVSYKIDNTSLDVFYENYCALQTVETMFSIYQLVKILHSMDLTYNDIIYKKKKSFKRYGEDTNVFAYHILKSVWLFSQKRCVSWMYKNNISTIFSGKNINYIKDLVNETRENYYKYPKFLQFIKKYEKYFARYDKIKRNNQTKEIKMIGNMKYKETVSLRRDDLLNNSLRMTILEV